MDNVSRYGFRWATAHNSHPCPNPLRKTIADGYQAKADNTTSNVDLNIGDPVKLLNDGTVALANTGEAVFGIIMGFEPRWDGSVMTPTVRLPGGTSGGGLWERKSTALVVPAEAGRWEADFIPATALAVRASFEPWIGENIDHVIVADVSNPSQPKANPKLSGAHAAATAQWRFYAVSDSLENQDFAGNFIKFIVVINEGQATAPGGVVGV